MDQNMLSDYPINKFKVSFCSVSVYTHVAGIELYSRVGICLKLNCFPLLSLIFYLLFESFLK